MATVFRLTITIGKGAAQRTRAIEVDPDDIPLGLLEDLETAQETHRWADIRRAMSGFFGLTDEEFRSITAGQFVQIAEAMKGAIGSATTLPNGQAPSSA